MKTFCLFLILASQIAIFAAETQVKDTPLIAEITITQGTGSGAPVIKASFLPKFGLTVPVEIKTVGVCSLDLAVIDEDSNNPKALVMELSTSNAQASAQGPYFKKLYGATLPLKLGAKNQITVLSSPTLNISVTISETAPAE